MIFYNYFNLCLYLKYLPNQLRWPLSRRRTLRRRVLTLLVFPVSGLIPRGWKLRWAMDVLPSTSLFVDGFTRMIIPSGFTQVITIFLRRRHIEDWIVCVMSPSFFRSWTLSIVVLKVFYFFSILSKYLKKCFLFYSSYILFFNVFSERQVFHCDRSCIACVLRFCNFCFRSWICGRVCMHVFVWDMSGCHHEEWDPNVGRVWLCVVLLDFQACGSDSHQVLFAFPSAIPVTTVYDWYVVSGGGGVAFHDICWLRISGGIKTFSDSQTSCGWVLDTLLLRRFARVAMTVRLRLHLPRLAVDDWFVSIRRTVSDCDWSHYCQIFFILTKIIKIKKKNVLHVQLNQFYQLTSLCVILLTTISVKMSDPKSTPKLPKCSICIARGATKTITISTVGINMPWCGECRYEKD